jgi:hypothetical protein
MKRDCKVRATLENIATTSTSASYALKGFGRRNGVSWLIRGLCLLELPKSAKKKSVA